MSFSGKTAAAATLVTAEEIPVLAARAREFLCRKGFCISAKIPIHQKEVSNYRGFFHRDLKEISLSPDLDLIGAQLTMIHEYTHAFRHQFATNEELWLEEGLAKLMEYQYSRVWPMSYMDRLRKKPLLILSNDSKDFQPAGIGYPSGFFLMLYLYNRCGGENFLRKVMSSTKTGWDNISSTIETLRAEGTLKIPAEFTTKESLLRHFAVALWLNDAFAAKYSLFFIDSSFQPLHSADAKLFQSRPEGQGTRIFFGSQWMPTKEKVYSIRKDPLLIQSATENQIADGFIFTEN